MSDLINRKHFYETLSKSAVRENFSEDDFDYIIFLLLSEPVARCETAQFETGGKR